MLGTMTRLEYHLLHYLNDTEIKTLTVSELNFLVGTVLEEQFPFIWVEGEISNLAKPSSGHYYFSLKDANAQVKCALFRAKAMQSRVRLQDGLQIRALAKVGLYQPRGDYQLIVETVEVAGDGILQRMFLQLKDKLAAEGLFAETHKRPLPRLPHCVGVITSATGAALRDVLSVLKRRCPSLPVIIYPTLVQGNEAAKGIVSALQLANQRAECKVLLLVRGGGSLEDLWPFNEEIVARAIYLSQIPIVSGIGHQVDFTIADFVADVRAATPSAAAELVSPVAAEWLNDIAAKEARLQRAWHHQWTKWQHQLAVLRQQLRHPGERLQSQAQKLDYLERHLIQAYQQRLFFLQQKLEYLLRSLQQNLPKTASFVQQVQHMGYRLQIALNANWQKASERLARAIVGLDTLSPLATLSRGYAIVTNNQYQVIDSADAVVIGELVDVRLARGQLRCEIKGREIKK